ncbi:hypothetical protein CY35_03G121700 [Sphagnum magellanicum]|nr:hypothetical protein CY35_03G121700 [Sphagnum magellanicum]KAH9569229.1 hypothetical protein CY35_03G121700 [Sphagnum magellanicum]KAH9569230.1 hypothetical protein CY35_03G121700 [Sphagnum magellanicum]KAH9569231.1 hypothetical protein CY35_03G121700 [Sphagnum magellanicum]KAH9569232.1 hypothetical protein CY35_03G121700 [Sphagnum magellanicum]
MTSKHASLDRFQGKAYIVAIACKSWVLTIEYVVAVTCNPGLAFTISWQIRLVGGEEFYLPFHLVKYIRATEECEITGSKHRREKSDNDDERRFKAKEEEREKRQLECSWCRLWMTERKKRLQRGRSSLFNLSLSLAHRIAGGSIFCWTLFLSVCVERVFLLLHRLVFSADLVSCNSRSSVQLKDAAEKESKCVFPYF